MSSSTTTPRSNKAKKSYANCPSIQLVIRDNKGWRLYKQHHKTGKLQIQSSTKPCTDADIIFSDDGAYFAVLLEAGIEIYESSGGRKLHFLEHYRVRNVYFSPNNTFIVSYHHRRADDKHGNCWVWKWKSSPSSTSSSAADQKQNDEASNNTAAPSQASNTDTDGDSNDIKVIYQFFLPEFDKKRVPLQFSNDEFMAARITRNAVIIHDVQRLHYRSNNIIGKLDIANVASVVVAPTRRQQSTAQNSYLLAVFAMPKNNKAATVTIYEYQYSLAMNKKSNTTKLFTKISQRAFYGVDQCELLWDPTTSYHHNLLAIASSDVDESGKSYYGNQTLFLLSSRNNITVKIPISDKGKLQDVKWHPYGKEFVLIDDHPQKITVFDYKGHEVVGLGKYARNLIRFSRDGRFLWCGGFGNLTGEMTFYDYKMIKNEKQNVLGYNTDDACRYFAWSPDSSTFVTARLYPYMTVDNGFRIYKYNGYKLYEESFDRLYQIAYRPSLKGVYPQRSPSPNARGKAKTLPKPQAKKRYVPPHLRKDKGQQKQKQPQQQQQQKQQRAPPPPRQQQQQQQQRQQGQRQMASAQQQQQQQNQQQQQQGNYHSNYPQNYQQMGNVGGYQQQQQQQRQQQGQYGMNHAQGRDQRNNAYYTQQTVPPQQQQQGYGGFVAHNNGHQGSHGNQKNMNFVTGIYQHGMEHGDYIQPQQVHHQQQVQQTQQQFEQMNMNQPQQQQQGNVNQNNNMDEMVDGGDGGNKKRRRRRKSNKNKGNQVQSNNQGNGGGGGFKPGLHENDNKRWARGSKYTE